MNTCCGVYYQGRKKEYLVDASEWRPCDSCRERARLSKHESRSGTPTSIVQSLATTLSREASPAPPKPASHDSTVSLCVDMETSVCADTPSRVEYGVVSVLPPAPVEVEPMTHVLDHLPITDFSTLTTCRIRTSDVTAWQEWYDVTRSTNVAPYKHHVFTGFKQRARRSSRHYTSLLPSQLSRHLPHRDVTRCVVSPSWRHRRLLGRSNVRRCSWNAVVVFILEYLRTCASFTLIFSVSMFLCLSLQLSCSVWVSQTTYTCTCICFTIEPSFKLLNVLCPSFEHLIYVRYRNLHLYSSYLYSEYRKSSNSFKAILKTEISRMCLWTYLSVVGIRYSTSLVLLMAVLSFVLGLSFVLVPN